MNVNQAAIKQLGYAYEELVNHSVLSVFPKEYHDTVLKTIDLCYNNPEKQLEWELVKHKKDGTLIHVHEVAQVVHFDAEDPKLLIVCTDITERKEAEIKLKALAQELSKQNEDLRRFAYITSHDLRAPVINLNALLNHFDEKNPNNPLNADLIQKFKQSAVRISDTLNDLLEVTKIKDRAHAEERITCDIAKCLSDCIADNTEKIKEVQAKITTDFSSISEVFFSKAVLNSAFTNLLTNAIKYRSKDRLLTLHISSKLVGDHCVITFSDNGIGMDIEKYRNRLFTLYQRFHPHIEGKGLGLYLVKSQLEALGGSLHVESTEDVGSTFFIHIPLNT
jgi:PAS domain S-box-containing protein